MSLTNENQMSIVENEASILITPDEDGKLMLIVNDQFIDKYDTYTAALEQAQFLVNE